MELPLMPASLILEGGGQRGIFTSGVLRALMGESLWLEAVYGVSMGACNGANYVSRQAERNGRVNIQYIDDRRYLSYRRWLTGGELFGLEFIFHDVPNKLDLFDFETYRNSPQKLHVGVTDCMTGEAEFFDQAEQGDDIMQLFRASCALPIVSYPVKLRGHVFMDGGIADPIPLKRSLADGHEKHLIILTQPDGYRKQPSSSTFFAKLRHPGLKGLHKALSSRHERYNQTMELVEELERKGEALIIRPSGDLGVKRICRNRPLLEELYAQGIAEGETRMDDIKSFLAK